MILTLNNFVENDYVIEPALTSSDSYINGVTGVNHVFLNTVQYIRAFPSYKKHIHSGVDLFEFLNNDSRERLKNSNTVFFMDMSMEGFDPTMVPIAQSLHNSCLKHNIDCRKIFYLTANHKELSLYEYFKNIFNYKTGINIVQTIQISDMVVRGLPNETNDINYHIEKTKELHNNKYFLHLSRRNRSHRILANFLLTKSSYSEYGLISQDKLTEYDMHNALSYHNNQGQTGHELTMEEFVDFNNKLPLIADSSDFKTNWASYRSDDLYHSTIFSVVLETSADDMGQIAMFPSEKLFKPIVQRQPMIVYGHMGINTFIRQLGFKTYDDWFDIDSFDFITDPVLRYQKILSQVKGICQNLNKMTKQERINFKFKNHEVLNHNYNVLVKETRRQFEIENIHKTIKSLFYGNFYSYINSKGYY